MKLQWKRSRCQKIGESENIRPEVNVQKLPWCLSLSLTEEGITRRHIALPVLFYFDEFKVLCNCEETMLATLPTMSTISQILHIMNGRGNKENIQWYWHPHAMHNYDLLQTSNAVTGLNFHLSKIVFLSSSISINLKMCFPCLKFPSISSFVFLILHFQDTPNYVHCWHEIANLKTKPKYQIRVTQIQNLHRMLKRRGMRGLVDHYFW